MLPGLLLCDGAYECSESNIVAASASSIVLPISNALPGVMGSACCMTVLPKDCGRITDCGVGGSMAGDKETLDIV